jgi:hypothetical protein
VANPRDMDRMPIGLSPLYRFFLGLGSVQHAVRSVLDNIVLDRFAFLSSLGSWLNECVAIVGLHKSTRQRWSCWFVRAYTLWPFSRRTITTRPWGFPYRHLTERRIAFCAPIINQLQRLSPSPVTNFCDRHHWLAATLTNWCRISKRSVRNYAVGGHWSVTGRTTARSTRPT